MLFSVSALPNAKKDYSKNDKVANRYPTFEPKPERKFDRLWAEFVAPKGLAASTRKKWEPYFAQLIKRVGTDDMSRVTEQRLLDWRDALLAAGVSAQPPEEADLSLRLFLRSGVDEIDFDVGKARA